MIKYSSMVKKIGDTFWGVENAILSGLKKHSMYKAVPQDVDIYPYRHLDTQTLCVIIINALIRCRNISSIQFE